MQLAVINPGGKDPDQSFPDFAGPVDPRVHAPVNYHAYAACTGGGFFRQTAGIREQPVLLLLRRDLKVAFQALQQLKQNGCCVAVSWKESGLHQVAQQLDSPGNIKLFRQICVLADGALSSTPDLVGLYVAAGARCCRFIPTPYPLEDQRWDFQTPCAQRRGVFIGTREFEVPSRNHLAALLVARTLGEPVTVFNFEGRSARRKLESLGCARILERRVSYPEYLKIMAQHRLVFQLDRSAVPGQVGGDALLCRVPCIGGNGATERLFSAQTRNLTFDGLQAFAARLLQDPVFHDAYMKESLGAAAAALGYRPVAEQLQSFYGQLRSSALAKS